MSHQSILLFMGRDIFFLPTIKAAAQAVGWQFTLIGSADAQLAPDIEAAIGACVVDLTPLSLEQIAAIGSQLLSRFPNATKIAFGPHVQVEHFEAARTAGFEHVLPKGQVAHALSQLLK